MMFGEVGGRGSRVVVGFGDFGYSIWIIARFREIERNECLLISFELGILLNNLNIYFIW